VTIEGIVNTIEGILARVPRPEGFVGVHLVELATGDVLATLHATDVNGRGGGDGEPPPAAAELAGVVTESVRHLTEVIAREWAGDGVEDLVVTTSSHHHLVRLLPDLAGTEVLLLVTLDRVRSNLALARRLLLQLEVGLVP
jgi:hypothetical protein